MTYKECDGKGYKNPERVALKSQDPRCQDTFDTLSNSEKAKCSL
jgi:hypothetical protein